MQPGSTAIASVPIGARELSLVKQDGSRWVLPGEYTLQAGDEGDGGGSAASCALVLTGPPVQVAAAPPLRWTS